LKAARAFVAMGSNIDPDEHIKAAVLALAAQVQIVAISNVYRTEAEERPEQARFYNCVVEIRTEIPAFDLKFQVLRTIEAALGRHRTSDKFAPRSIDLDLIVYDELVVNADGLVLPDPDIVKRPFLAIPLSELAPDLTLSEVSLSIADVAFSMRAHKMQPLPVYTAQLRKALAANNY
jgi:dihydroneopterin aldolase/2-amino-4-hydroxy-6-hydroxymethyldihydropteridine diphosphokinase